MDVGVWQQDIFQLYTVLVYIILLRFYMFQTINIVFHSCSSIMQKEIRDNDVLIE